MPPLKAAFIYSIPVLLGYVAIGIAFGLLVYDTGYPWFLALFMSLWMYTGAGQFTAIGLFVSGAAIWEACLVQLVLSARHIAYGLSMINRFPDNKLKPYLVFSLTDETFALLSSLPEDKKENREKFMFYVSILDQSYWVGGTLIGALIGSFIPFDLEGIGFSLTALFIVLFLEQIFKSDFNFGKLGVFVLSAAAALVTVLLLPERITLLAGLILALVLSFFIEIIPGKRKPI
jgi:4-azaleucine resistance transporter AzlC